MAAGVNVLCEKPMALDVAACDRMIDAARLSGKTLMIAHCIRFWPEYAAAKQLVDSGIYGALLSASFRRVGAPPTWGQMNWFAEEERSGGVALDLHIHDVDFVAVESWGAMSPDGALGHLITRYDYGAGPLVTAEGGWMMTPSFGFEMSFTMVLEKATIVYDCTRDPVLRVCPADDDAFTPKVAGGDGYSQEIEHFAAVLRGDSELLITPEQARDAVRLVTAERESLRRGASVALPSA
jgi:predicted dehydrogenase